jgi:hypothetical protein
MISSSWNRRTIAGMGVPPHKKICLRDSQDNGKNTNQGAFDVRFYKLVFVLLAKLVSINQ